MNAENWLLESNAWLDEISASRRAVLAYRRIQRNPDVITIWRNGAEQSGQTVRIVSGGSISQDDSILDNESNLQKVTVFGVVNHPNVDDTDILEGDDFYINDREYVVLSVDKETYPGELRAIAEARS